MHPRWGSRGARRAGTPELLAPAAARTTLAAALQPARRGGAASDLLRVRPPRARGLRPPEPAAHDSEAATQGGCPDARAAARARSHRAPGRGVPDTGERDRARGDHREEIRWPVSQRSLVRVAQDQGATHWRLRRRRLYRARRNAGTP